MSIHTRSILLSGLICALMSAPAAHGALAIKSGGSGYSGTLSKNKSIRQQQLAADPNEPIDGTTSTTYNPTIVSLVDVIAGPTYSITGGSVAVHGSEGVFLQNIFSFLDSPAGPEAGYVQVAYSSGSIGFAAQAVGGAGQIPLSPGFTTTGHAGVNGVDTHAMFFHYNDGVASSTVATYTVLAANSDAFYGNDADFMRGIDQDGLFQLGPGDLSPATISGSLDSPAVPLPPAVWTGLVGLIGVAACRKSFSRLVPVRVG